MNPSLAVDITYIAILVVLVGVAAYFASLGETHWAERIGSFAVGVGIAFAGVRFSTRRR